MIGRERDCASVRGRRLLQIALLAQDLAEVDVALDQLRVEAQGALAGGERLVEPAGRLQHGGEVVVGLGEVMPGRDRAAQEAQRVLRAPELERGHAAAGEPVGMIRVAEQQPPVQRVGLGVAAALAVRMRQPHRLGRRDRLQALRTRRRSRRFAGLARLPLLSTAFRPVHRLPGLSSGNVCRPCRRR